MLVLLLSLPAVSILFLFKDGSSLIFLVKYFFIVPKRSPGDVLEKRYLNYRKNIKIREKIPVLESSLLVKLQDTLHKK